MYCKAQQFYCQNPTIFFVDSCTKKDICLPIWKIEKNEKFNERIPQEKNIRL